MNFFHEIKEILKPIVEKELENINMLNGAVYLKDRLPNAEKISFRYTDEFRRKQQIKDMKIRFTEKETKELYESLSEIIHLPDIGDCEQLIIYFSYDRNTRIHVEWKMQTKKHS